MTKYKITKVNNEWNRNYISGKCDKYKNEENVEGE